MLKGECYHAWGCVVHVENTSQKPVQVVGRQVRVLIVALKCCRCQGWF